MKEGKSQKNFKISIRAKILTGMIACVLIVTNLIGWFFIVQAKDTLLEPVSYTHLRAHET